MYRDDVCAVCGESLPPDHFYCREHGATVDDRLHEIGDLLPRVLNDVAHLAELLDGIAPETWDYLAAAEPDDPIWPPAPAISIRADGDDIDVDVDSEPGFVSVRLTTPAAAVLAAIASGFESDDWRRVADRAASTQGANATH